VQSVFEPAPPPPVFEPLPEVPPGPDPVLPDAEPLLPADVVPALELVPEVAAVAAFVTTAPVGESACQRPASPWPLTSPGRRSPEYR
jgi:hypothetical protein